MLETFHIEQFNEKNIYDLHDFFENQAGLYKFPLQSFKQATILDDDFLRDTSLVLREKNTRKIIAACIAIIRKTKIAILSKEIPYKFTTLNMFAVHKEYRRRGIGTDMLNSLFSKLKSLKRRKIRLMASIPNYIWPGLDPRYTAAYFLLKKLGFKRKKGERKNLVYKIPENLPEPRSKFENYRISRALYDDLDNLVDYIKHNHSGVWQIEATLSFANDPCTTFLVKDEKGTVVGFASHSIGFPGSFGPTGVLKELRGRGIGGALLKWCMKDLQDQGIKESIIRWVEGDTMKFYSKSIGARVHQVYWKMQKRL
jgi:ribosomal protein S18 acetylase RimI-like enzyme